MSQTEFAWLVELRPAFEGHPLFTPVYYAGFMVDMAHPARTHDPVSAPRFARKEDAEHVAKQLLGTLSCQWLAVEHGFHSN